MVLVEIIFKTFPRIGRGEVLRSNRNRCKAFVADISRTCLKQTCRRCVKTSSQLFARNAVDFGTGASRSFFGGRTRRRLRRNKNGATAVLQGGATSRAAQLSSDSHTTPLVFKKSGCASVAVSGKASEITEDFRTRGGLNAGITRAKSLAAPENNSDKIQRGSNDDQENAVDLGFRDASDGHLRPLFVGSSNTPSPATTIGWRTFRHSYASQLKANGDNVKVVARVFASCQQPNHSRWVDPGQHAART
jgi:hypothetical protein